MTKKEFEKITKRGEGEKPSPSSAYKAYADIKMKSAMADYNKGIEAMSGIYEGWQSPDEVERRNAIARDASRKMLSARNTYGIDTYDDAIATYNKSLAGIDDIAKGYAYYKNGDAYRKAQKNYEFSQKYNGSSYADIQKALTSVEDQDEADFLKGYTKFSSLEDFDQALATASGDYKKGLKREREAYEKAHRFDKYADIRNNADFGEVLPSAMDELRRYEMSVATDPMRALTRGNIAFADSLDDDKYEIAAYIFKTQGEKAYKDFMKDMTFEARQNEAAEIRSELNAAAENNPVASTVINTLANPIFGFMGGVEQIGATLSGSKDPTISSLLTKGMSEANSVVAQNIKEEAGWLPSFAYEVFTTGVPNRVGQMLYGKAYTAVMGMSSFATTYADEIANGADTTSALWKAFASGAIETLTELIPWDLAFGNGKTWYTTMAKQMFFEGSEEAIGALANLTYDTLANGGYSEFQQKVQRYVEQGYERSQAESMAWKDFAIDTAKQFAIAALSVAPTTGTASITQAVQESSAGQFVNREMLGEIDNADLKKKYGDEWTQKASNREVYKAYSDYVGNLQSESEEAEKKATAQAIAQEYKISDEEATKWAEALYNGDKKMLKTHFGQALTEDVNNREGWTKAIDTTETTKIASKLNKAFSMIKTKDQVSAEKASKAIKTGEKNLVNGKEAQIISMTENKDGSYTVKTSEGEVNAKDVTVTEQKATALTYSANIENEAFKEAYVRYYAGEDIADYDTYARYLYNAGRQGIDYSDKTNILDTLGVAKAQAIYNVGALEALQEEIEDAKLVDEVTKKYAEKFRPGTFKAGEYSNGKFKENKDFFRNLNRTQKRLYKIVESFSKLSGVNVRMYLDRDAASENGQFVAGKNGGTIYINLAARPFADNAYGINQYVISTLSHELTHWLKANNREAYNILEEAVKKDLQKAKTFEKRISTERKSLLKTHENELKEAGKSEEEIKAEMEKYEQKKDLDEIALEEVVARACEDMLNDADTMQEVLSFADQDGLTKLQSALKKWFDHIRGFFRDLMGGFHAPNEVVADLQKSYAHLQELWVNGMKEAIAQNRREQKTTQKAVASIKLGNNGIKDVYLSTNEMNANLHEVHNMDSVATVDFLNMNIVNEPSIDNKNASDHMIKNGWEYVDSDLVGTIDIAHEGIADYYRHGKREYKTPILNAIPYVIKYGKIVSGDINHKGKKNDFNTLVFAAPITFEGTGYKGDKAGTYYVAVSVLRDFSKRTKKQNLHVADALIYKKENPNLVSAIKNGREADASFLSLRNILEHIDADVNIFEGSDEKRHYSQKLSSTLEYGTITDASLKDLFDSLNPDKEMKALGEKVFDAFHTMQRRAIESSWDYPYAIYFFDKENYRKKSANPTTAGEFSPEGKLGTRGIIYNTDLMNELSDNDKAKVILHEVIHAVTVNSIRDAQEYLEPRKNEFLSNPQKIIEEAPADRIKGGIALIGIYNQIRTKGADTYYGCSNVYEMVAELANPEFRGYLKKQSLWGKIIDAIKKILGLKDNAYDASVDALEMILSEYAPKTQARKSTKMDSEGKTLTENQVRFFENSKARDEHGNLMVMYHGSRGAGFTVFNPKNSDDGRSLFFTNRLDVASGYTATSELFEPDRPMSFKELSEKMQSFSHGELNLIKDGNDYVITEEGIIGEEPHEIFRGTLKKAQEFFIDSIEDLVNENSAVYKVYLNLENPLIIDAKGNYWDELPLPEDYDESFSDIDIYESGDGFEADWTENGESKHGQFASWDAVEKKFGSLYEKMQSGSIHIDDIYLGFDGNRLPTNTREYATYAQNHGYDGVIINNVIDQGLYSSDKFGQSTVMIAFEANQIKSVYNESPTKDKDIRKSVKMDSNGKVLTEGQQNYFKDSKVVDDQGRLLVVYHGTYEDFEAFKPNKFTTEKNGLSKIVGYFSEDKEYAKIYGDTKAYYLNIKNPLVMDGEAKTLKEWEKFFKANGVTNFEFDSSVTGKNGQADPLKGGRFEDGTYYAFYELLDSSEYWYGDGNLSERIQAAGYDGIQSNDEFEKAWMPFNAEAVKSVDNANPTDSESVLKSTKLPPEAQKLVDELTLENKRLTEENTALKMERGLEKVQAEKRAIIDKITEQSQVLSRWLLTNDKTNPVPQAIKEPLGKLLTSISYTKDDYEWRKSKGNLTKAEETLGQRMAKISQLLLEIEQDKAVDKDAYDLSQLDWIPEFTTEFAKIKDAVAAVEARQGENFNLSKMSTEDLKSLSNMITALKSAITNMNKCLSAHNKESVSGVGQEIISYLDSIGQKKFDNRATQFLEMDNTVPFYFFKRLGAGGQKAFKLLMDGMNQYAFEAKQIEDYAKKVFSGKDVNAWRNEVKTFTVDEIEYGTVKGEDLVQPRKKTIQMTVPQIMSLYCLSKRDQAVNHLKTGGIKIGDFKVKGAKETTRQIENTTLTKASLETIINSLTAEQKEVADKLQEFMNTVCQKWGNEITMKRFGFKGMTEKNYFPIKVDQNQLSREARQRGTSLYQLLNMGFTKPINPNAKNPIEIFDIFEVFAMHSTEMAQYHSLALPVLDVIRIWNYKDVEMLDEAEDKAHWHSVKASIENTLGAQGNRYIGLLLADMNGDVSGGRADDFAGKMMKNYKTAAVAANLQVAALQPLSYIRAGYMIDSKYLAKGMAMKSTKDALKWCGIAVWKDMGFYNTSIHRGLEHKIMQDESKKESIIEKGLYLAGKADEWTWSKLWNACLLETQDKYPNLKGDDLYKKTAERLTEVIYGTQVVDSILTRSQIMRDKTMYSKMITAFQSEPTLALNVLMDAAESFSMEARRSGKQAALKKYGETIRRAATIYLISSAVESLLRAVIGKIRNYDGDEDDENLIVDFFKRFIEELNPLRKIPIIKDAWSILFDGFKVIFGWQYKIYTDTRMDEAIFENLGKATIRIGNLIKGKTVNFKVVYEIAKGIDASGLPASSTFRALKVLWNNTVGRIWPGITLK